MTASRVDANQAEIVAALRGVGATVQPLHDVGHGVPDLLVCYRQVLYLLEVKQKDGRLTPAQREWHALWGGPVHVVRSRAAALRAIGIEMPEPTVMDAAGGVGRKGAA